MRSLKKKMLNEQLTKDLAPYGFKRRGEAFFRIIGDGVLQVIKFEYERVMEEFDLSVGLFSLYGELLPQWFTSSGCIPQYSVVNFINQRDPVYMWERDGITYSWTISSEKQMRILMHRGIPWLNEIQTQEQLAEGICWFDKQDGKDILWNDSLKIAPFLVSGQKKKAARVVSAILKQHISCAPKEHPAEKIFWSDYVWDEDMINTYCKLFPDKDEEFLSLHRMINRNDEEEIRAYLMENYNQNMQYAAFCKKK